MLLRRTLFCLIILLTQLGVMEVPATLETEASPYPLDSVDDIAVWKHPTNPEKSLIIATLKNSNQHPPLATGLLVYDLEGKKQQFLKGGTPNNVDLREGFTLGDDTFTLITASHWMTNSVGFYRINPSSLKLEPLLKELIPVGMVEAKGLCMHRDNNRFYFFVSSQTGLIHQFQILPSEREIKIKRVRRIKLSSRTEGCVVDDETHRLYAAEETRGIWRMDTRPNKGNKRILVDSTSIFKDLSRDVEGLALYKGINGEGYLFASSQKKNRFVIYDRKSNDYIGSFTISGGETTDAVSYTDGIEVIPGYMGDNFPKGIFIAQDNENTSEKNELLKQNFKLVDWSRIQTSIDKMKID